MKSTLPLEKKIRRRRGEIIALGGGFSSFLCVPLFSRMISKENVQPGARSALSLATEEFLGTVALLLLWG